MKMFTRHTRILAAAIAVPLAVMSVHWELPCFRCRVISSLKILVLIDNDLTNNLNN